MRGKDGFAAACGQAQTDIRQVVELGCGIVGHSETVTAKVVS